MRNISGVLDRLCIIRLVVWMQTCGLDCVFELKLGMASNITSLLGMQMVSRLPYQAVTLDN